ncbi:MAG TPA: aminomethyl-transferring glycine dehydrogenase subunit GcvPA [Candidatus Limnocylindria bacterium]|nr:aminomethyl-transferring glycine dehydrogenase subunit GcvPA [Candidatus Limnocylindria bacterium]
MNNNPYSPHTDADRAAMLKRVGAKSVDDLLTAIPKDALRPKLGLPAGMSEIEIQAHLESLAAKNRMAGAGPFFLGGPVQRRYIPAAVPVLALRGEFLTAYTPYQPEVSQGTLQSIFEYQSLIAELLSMDVANSSMYEGGSAVAEAAFMAVRATGRKRVVVANEVYFEFRRTLRTYARGPELEIVEVAARDLAASAAGAACLLVQHPDAFGGLVDVRAIADAAHAAGALCIQVTEPHANALLEPPGALGADITVGEGQPLGIPMSFGGPYLGILACRSGLVRQMPGRVVGETRDARGMRGFVNTLQTREQHIRREKATSNICTNEAIAAITAAVYLGLMGPHGLRAAASLGVEKAHALAHRLGALPGCSVSTEGDFFDRFGLRVPRLAPGLEGGGYAMRNALLVDDILVEATTPHYGDRDDLIIQCTEMTTDAEMDALVAAIESIAARARETVVAR